MAWTAPRTWTDGELVTKAIMDPHIRDNFLSMGPHLIVRKTADETVTSNTTLQDDNHLLMAVTGSDVWLVRFILIYTGANGTGDLKCGFTLPASGRIDASGSVQIDGSAALGVSNFSGTTPVTGTRSFNARGTTERTVLTIEGVYAGAGTAGNVTLQWAQNTSSGTATTVYTHSTLWAVKLA